MPFSGAWGVRCGFDGLQSKAELGGHRSPRPHAPPPAPASAGVRLAESAVLVSSLRPCCPSVCPTKADASCRETRERLSHHIERRIYCRYWLITDVPWHFDSSGIPDAEPASMSRGLRGCLQSGAPHVEGTPESKNWHVRKKFRRWQWSANSSVLSF